MQPATFFLILIQFVSFAAIQFFMSINFVNHVPVSVNFFGNELHETGAFFKMMVPSLTSALHNIFIFLFILIISENVIKMFSDPLLNIILSEKTSRIKLTLSGIGGSLTAAALNIIIYSVLLTVILTFKNEGNLIAAPLQAAILLIYEVLILSGLTVFFAVLTGSHTGIVLLNISVYFIIGSMLLSHSAAESTTIKAISCLVPDMGTLRKLIDINPPVNTIHYAAIILPGILAALYFCIGALIFNRRDL